MNVLAILTERLGEQLKAKNFMVATAESCTGGGVAEAITTVSGSSQWFDRGFVTYSNTAKQEMLGVNKDTLDQYGAVSEETAKEMAEGAIKHSHADLSVAITGVAGPTGGTKKNPVGTVWFGWATHERTVSKKEFFSGDRHEIRQQAVITALNGLLKLI